eukprot:s2485_g5.t1
MGKAAGDSGRPAGFSFCSRYAALTPRCTCLLEKHTVQDVLTDPDAFGFPREYAVRCLQLNKHNHVTTTYYLLNEKKRRLMERLQRIPGVRPFIQCNCHGVVSRSWEVTLGE